MTLVGAGQGVKPPGKGVTEFDGYSGVGTDFSKRRS